MSEDGFSGIRNLLKPAESLDLGTSSFSLGVFLVGDLFMPCKKSYSYSLERIL